MGEKNKKGKEKVRWFVEKMWRGWEYLRNIFDVFLKNITDFT